MAKWCSERGIKHEKSVPYTPQHNGSAESLNKALLLCMRPMLIDAGYPLTYWGEAANCAMHLRNRTMVAATGKTPYEPFFKKRSDFSHLRIFEFLSKTCMP